MNRPLDPARPGARTRLTWQRTALTGLVAMVGIVRLLVGTSPRLGVVVGAVAILALVWPLWSATRWQLAVRAGRGPHPIDARAPALLAVVVSVSALAGLVYTLS